MLNGNIKHNVTIFLSSHFTVVIRLVFFCCLPFLFRSLSLSFCIGFLLFESERVRIVMLLLVNLIRDNNSLVLNGRKSGDDGMIFSVEQ